MITDHTHLCSFSIDLEFGSRCSVLLCFFQDSCELPGQFLKLGGIIDDGIAHLLNQDHLSGLLRWCRFHFGNGLDNFDVPAELFCDQTFQTFAGVHNGSKVRRTIP